MTNENNIEIENISIYKYDEEYYKAVCKYKDNKFQVRIKSKSITSESINELLKELKQLINNYIEYEKTKTLENQIIKNSF